MENKPSYNFIIVTGAILILLGFARYIPEIKQSAWQDPIQAIQAIGFALYGLGIFLKKRKGKGVPKTDNQT